MATTKQANKRPAAGATQADTLAAMQILLERGVPVLLWGDPGTGKTHTIEAFARQAGWKTVSVIASIHDPTDFAGLPVRTDAGVVFEPPAWARRTAEHDGTSLVFFDEVNTATPRPRTRSCGWCWRAASAIWSWGTGSVSRRRPTRRHRTARHGISARLWRTGSLIWSGL